MQGTQVFETSAEANQSLVQHVEPSAAEPLSLLMVFPAEKDRRTLERIVASCGWTVYWATSCEAALRFAQHAHPRVVLCDAELPDGGWQQIWNVLSRDSQPPRLIVASPNANENFWVQVLGEGGHDVLLKPFCAEEVVWAIGCASPQCGAHPQSHCG